MDAKEPEVLSRDGRSIYSPGASKSQEHSERRARNSAEEIYVRYRRMGNIPKLIALPFFVLALGTVFVVLSLLGVFMFISMMRKGFLQLFFRR